MSAGDLLAEVLEAHGGRERWRGAGEIRAHARSGGFLLSTLPPRGMFADYRLTMRVAEPWIRFDLTGTDERAFFEGGGVRLERGDGVSIAERADPRPLFSGRSGLRRNLRWDRLDITYFAGYAMWNYLTTPLLLTRDEVELSEGEPWVTPDGETWRRLDARFEPGLDTHSERQTFYIGPDGLLRRHDYTAELVSRFAHAAHMLAEHRAVDGLVFPTRRWVRPIGPRNRPMPFPTMVWIELDQIEVGGE